MRHSTRGGHKTSSYSEPSPPVGGVELGRDHIQGVPSGDAEAVVEAQHEDHHGLAGAEPQEEAADSRQYHGTPCNVCGLVSDACISE